MKNKEKYAKEIIEIVCDGGRVAVKNGKPQHCNTLTCGKCDLSKAGKGCREEFKKWCNAEYGEPQVDWTKVPIDTPILIRDDERNKWFKRHFAKFENGQVYAFDSGLTSWTENTLIYPWEYAKLATDDELDENSILRAYGGKKSE